ncbi:hypothetical protein ACP4OV_013829 [Aristida adscensionis]
MKRREQMRKHQLIRHLYLRRTVPSIQKRVHFVRNHSMLRSFCCARRCLPTSSCSCS